MYLEIPIIKILGNREQGTELTKSEVRSQKRCDPATTPVAPGSAPRESEVNPPLAPPPPLLGGEVGDLSPAPKILRLKRRGFRPMLF
ncbi:MAG: hypothetical protein F6K24_43070 [Okeania sp. SIO2D1]|nr:hypothetical protein [Okeania sp. SIO2D1]